MEFFLCSKSKLLNWQYTKIHLSQKHYWENFKITDHKYWVWILKINVFLTDIGYLVKLQSNFATFSNH